MRNYGRSTERARDTRELIKLTSLFEINGKLRLISLSLSAYGEINEPLSVKLSQHIRLIIRTDTAIDRLLGEA
jgi:hypothetical protein